MFILTDERRLESLLITGAIQVIQTVKNIRFSGEEIEGPRGSRVEKGEAYLMQSIDANVVEDALHSGGLSESSRELVAAPISIVSHDRLATLFAWFANGQFRAATRTSPRTVKAAKRRPRSRPSSSTSMATSVGPPSSRRSNSISSASSHSPSSSISRGATARSAAAARPPSNLSPASRRGSIRTPVTPLANDETRETLSANLRQETEAKEQVCAVIRSLDISEA